MDELGGLRDLRRLRLIGLGAPVVFLVVFELIRVGILDVAFRGPASNLVAAAFGVAAALAFGFLMFFHIERAQRHIVRQNRDLAVVNAVSLAIQGELDARQVLEVGLRQLMRSVGAREARVTAAQADPEAGPGLDLVLSDEAASEDLLTAPDQVVEIPMSANAGQNARLRLRVPETSARRLPSPEALHMVGHQLASALQIGVLFGDLQRRKVEGHTIYQSLLQISNQAPLAEVLDFIVSGARERLLADEGRICLTDSVIDAFRGDRALSGGLNDGVGSEAPGAAVSVDPETRPHRCPIGQPSGYASTLHVPVWTPGELLGDLWLGRRAGAPFSERDRRFLMTLAGIAAIAITAARLREHERQGAILAERDRIARELHDSLAQVLGSTHLRLRAVLARPALGTGEGLAPLAAELEDLADLAEEAYRDVREAILGLREASHPRGLMESLEAYLARFSQQSGIDVELEAAVEGDPGLGASSEIQLIRVIQEALTNVRKHAQAAKARVKILGAGEGRGLTVVVEDDGRGFDPRIEGSHREGGYGLQTMRERMELAGGTLRVDSRPGKGTRVVAIIPEAAHGEDAVAVPGSH